MLVCASSAGTLCVPPAVAPTRAPADGMPLGLLMQLNAGAVPVGGAVIEIAVPTADDEPDAFAADDDAVAGLLAVLAGALLGAAVGALTDSTSRGPPTPHS